MTARHSTDSFIQQPADLKHRATAAWYNMGRPHVSKALPHRPPKAQTKVKHIAELAAASETAASESRREEAEITVGVETSELSSSKSPHKENDPLDKVMNDLLGEIDRTILEVGDVAVAKKLSTERRSAK